jgi:hypothetical protein
MPLDQAPDVFNGQVNGESRVSMLEQDIAYDKESSKYTTVVVGRL